MQPLTLRNNQGFTLIEMMVVVVILSIFAGMMSLSVGSTESRKNRAFYEHLIDSLEYVRLVSAERMQPMGLTLQPDNEGQVQPVIMQLNDPYVHLEAIQSSNATGDMRSKNSMELSAMSRDTEKTATPSWAVVDDVNLPTLPPDVSIQITNLDTSASASVFGTSHKNSQTLQPWFVGDNVPKALWYGTGEASPVRIEVRHNKRLVGDAILLSPDGRITVDH